MTAPSYKELLAQRESLEQQIAEARKSEIGNAVASIQELVAAYGLTQADIFPSMRGRTSSSKGGTVAPKYRNPETGATWTGRGKSPLWLRSEEDRIKFAIQAPAA